MNARSKVSVLNPLSVLNDRRVVVGSYYVRLVYVRSLYASCEPLTKHTVPSRPLLLPNFQDSCGERECR